MVSVKHVINSHGGRGRGGMARRLLLLFLEYSPVVILIGMLVFSVVAAWPGWDKEVDK